MKQFLLIITFLISTFSVLAASIIGGDLSYEKVGASSYEVHLKLYRDCTSGNTPFDANVEIKVRKGLGVVSGLDFDMPLVGVQETSSPIDSCSFGVCVETANYIKTVTLPSETEGYHLFYAYCCRDGGVDNITNPTNSGQVINTFIPNTVNWTSNSAPIWNNAPKAVVCMGQNFNLDYSAADADGDSLVYSLYTPYSDSIPSFNNTVDAPDNIQFPPVTWEPSFSNNNPFNTSGTTLTIDSNTGILSGVAEDVGQFVTGVKCEEYRGGVKIGEVVRDFQYQVFDCSSSQKAKIGQLNGCQGNIIDMVNDSPSGASNFYWDFGDGSPASTDYEPTHAFPGTGNFTVTLISQYGTPCADTATQTLKIGVVLSHIIAGTDSTCISDPVSFIDNSQAYGDMTIDSLLWDFGDGTTSTFSAPVHIFEESGDIDVKLIAGTDAGCYDSIIKTIYVQGLPDPDVGTDTAACINNPNLPLNASITNAIGGTWTGNGGAFSPNPNDLNATYIPTNAEVALGNTQIYLTTSGNGLCSSVTDTLNIEFIDRPTIDVGPNLNICADTTFIPLNAATQYANGVEWMTTNGMGSFIDPQLPNVVYIPSALDSGLDSVQFIAKSINNGACNEGRDTLWVKFTVSPSLGYIYPDTICENELIHLNAYSNTPVYGNWSTNGDGTFTTPGLHITDYTHGTTDLSNEGVTFYFETANNGVCPVQYDTLDVVLEPNPIADFSFNQVCYGTPTDLTSNITSSVPTSYYAWKTNSLVFSNAKDTSHVMPNDTNEVTFIAYTPNGCSDTVIKTIIPFPSPTSHFNVFNPCSNANTQFIDSSFIDGGSITNWDWDFDDGTTTNIQDPTHNYSTDANYNVQLIVTSSDGCKDTLVKPVDVFPGPEAIFTATPSSANVGDAITFVDYSTVDSLVNYWEWDFKDGSFSNGKNTSHSYNEGGEYDVSLYIEDVNGCVDSTNKTVNIRIKPSVPSAFSPNGDGNNDFLKVYGGAYQSLDFKVFNNWGEVVFKANNTSQVWDGKYKGKDQPVGVYVWTLKAKTNSGVEFEMSGDVSIIR